MDYAAVEVSEGVTDILMLVRPDSGLPLEFIVTAVNPS